jgi:hypothetical protein
VELVKDIIVNLANAVKAQQGSGSKHNDSIWKPLPVERFIEHDTETTNSNVVLSRKQYQLLFADNNRGSDG